LLKSGRIVEMKNDTAFLSNNNEYISFQYDDKVIRFKGPYSLIKFDKVTNWDNGYLVVNAFYTHAKDPEEDYIDLIPILERLYIDPKSFLEPIRKVEVRNV